MLDDADPQRVIFNAGAHSKAQMDELWERATEYDVALQTLALEISLPGSDYAVKLAKAIQRSVNSTGWVVGDIVRKSPGAYGEEAIAAAQAAHTEARDLADALARELRREGRPALRSRRRLRT